MNCEMCGAEAELYPSIVEGVELNVCRRCAGFGKRLRKPKVVKRKPKKKISKTEVIEVIRKDFAQIIKKKREKMGLKQTEFAKFLAEKESLVHKMESGTYKPSIELAQKLEKQLSVSLIEKKEVRPKELKSKSSAFTIGDMLNIK